MIKFLLRKQVEDGAYKVVKGSGLCRRFTTFDKDGNRVDDGLWRRSNLPQQQEYAKNNPVDDMEKEPIASFKLVMLTKKTQRLIQTMQVTG